AIATPRLVRRLVDFRPWPAVAAVAVAIPILHLGAVAVSWAPPEAGLLVLERTRLAGRVAVALREPRPLRLAELGRECGPSMELSSDRVRASRVGEPAVHGVLLIFVDSLRADRIGYRREGRSITPNLDALAARAARFDRAYTPSP